MGRLFINALFCLIIGAVTVTHYHSRLGYVLIGVALLAAAFLQFFVWQRWYRHKPVLPQRWRRTVWRTRPSGDHFGEGNYRE